MHDITPGQSQAPALPALWLASTERVASDRRTLARLAAVLSEDERQRWRALRSTQSQDLFLVAHYLKRRVLSICSPDRDELSWRFVSDRRGKPFVAPGHDGGLRFNLSHASSVAAVLVTRGQECGVDVEQLRADISCIDLAQRFFHPAEARVVNARGSEAFHAYWTVKEAFIKLMGAGLSFPLDRFCVDLERHPRISLDGIGPAAVEVFQRRLPGDYCLAAAIQGSAAVWPPAVRWLAELAPADRGDIALEHRTVDRSAAPSLPATTGSTSTCLPGPARIRASCSCGLRRERRGRCCRD